MIMRGFAVGGVPVFKDGFEAFVSKHGAEFGNVALIANFKLLSRLFRVVAIAPDGGFAGDAHF